MKPMRIFVCLLMLCAFYRAGAQEKYSAVKVYYKPGDITQRNTIIGMLEIDHFREEEGAVISEVNADLLKLVKAAGFKYDIITDDIAARVNRLNAEYYASLKKGVKPATETRVAIEVPGKPVSGIIKTPGAFVVQGTFGGFYSFAQMNAAMDALVLAYPGIASKTSIGTTVGGNNIWVIKISDNVATDETNEPEVLYMGLQHAREAIGGSSMIFFMQYLCEQYAAGNTKIKDLVDNRELFIIPCFNPDGWEYNRTSMSGAAGGSWRKNRRNNGDGTFGVDLNRNWGVDWANCSAPILGVASSCGTATTSSDTYWGTAAFSEAETNAVKLFAQSHHLVAGFDQHAYGPYYSVPFGRHSLHTLSPKGADFYNLVPALMGQYNGMRAADSYDALGYEVAGGFKDWMLMGNLGTGTKDTVWAMTGEGAAGGGGPYGTMADFWPPAAQIVNLSAAMCYQNLQLAYAAGTYVDIQDLDDIAVTSLTGNFDFSIQRVGLGNDPITVSLIPLENIQTSGGPVVISSQPVYNMASTGAIPYTLFPTLGTGQRIKFIWKVQTAGYTYADTITKFYNPTIVMSDNMESPNTFATNWLNTASGVNSATPYAYNYTNGTFAFTTTGGYGGSKALSESVAGTNYTTKALKICQYKNSFSLVGATAAYLSFWVKHRAENFRDKLQVQVSTNGTSWTSIEGSTTIEEPGVLDESTINGDPSLTGIRDIWTHEVFNMTSVLGNATVYFRFRFTSDDDPSSFKFELDDGFYIDNVQLIKSNATFLNLLPVSFISFSGNLLPAKKIGLNWEIVTDKSHAYFEVEKSADGRSFNSIGRVTTGAHYDFTDNTPFIGNNYYRIKAIDVDGKTTLSKVINIPYSAGKAGVVIYPNPVTDLLQLRLNDRTTGNVDINITDVHGRVVYTATDVENNGNEIKINTHSFLPQVYILKVTGKQGSIISIEKFMKQL
jgi:carboxypeptidase T